jgi:hypothetical protein
MTRQVFIKKLRKNLNFLKKEDLEKEVLYYINEIDKSKLADEVVIKNFGSINDIVLKTCQKYNIDYKEVTSKNLIGKIKYFYRELVSLGTKLKSSDMKQKTKILGDLLFLIILTCFLKIPFIFIRDIGDKVIEVFLNNAMLYLALWGLIIELGYVFFALCFFTKTFQKWFFKMDIK